jgi:hypothetical protein
MLRRLSIHLLFACFLLLTQQLALAHGSSHPLKGGLGESQTCHTCLMSAQIGAPLPSCSPDFGSDLRFALCSSSPTVAVIAFRFCAFQPRAPPNFA